MNQRQTAYDDFTALRERNPRKLIMLAVGDFYELFDDDARWAGEHLSLTVTSRAKKGEPILPMVGFPHYQLHGYVARAIELGREVLVVE